MYSEPSAFDTTDESARARSWTEALPQTDHVCFVKNVDWAQTALGPMQHWGTSLRMYTRMVMSDSRAATLYWGPNQIAIYNASFVPLAAGAHPLLMGQPFAYGFPELDPFIRPMFEEGMRSGKAQDVVEAPMMVERNGYTEEAFFTGNFTPIRGVDGSIEGFYNSLFEVTRQKILDGRKNMLNLLATPAILSVDGMCSHIMASLETDPLDIPMAILYEADTAAEPGKTTLRVRGHLGIPGGQLRSKAINTTVMAEASIDGLNIDYLQFDASRVTQIFINLLTIAIKFMKEGGEREIEVRYGASLSPPQSADNIVLYPEGVRWAPLGENASDVMDNPEWGSGPAVYLTFSLADTGIGMRIDEVEKIFERFRQASVMTHVTYGGSGLGLFISKELTERMAGKIGVMSNPAMGSLFVFYIKTRRAQEKQTSTALPLRLLPTRALSEIKTHKPHVLLVDDNIINQKLLRKHLARSDWKVEVANHGVEALDILCKPEARFDVVLMDMQMPVMDGLACTREIRDLEKAGMLPGRLPIIAVTANVRKEQIEKALAAGADRVFQKPFKASDLVSLMRELIDGMPDGENQPQDVPSAEAQAGAQ